LTLRILWNLIPVCIAALHNEGEAVIPEVLSDPLDGFNCHGKGIIAVEPKGIVHQRIKDILEVYE
jgi:hypothetical protein